VALNAYYPPNVPSPRRCYQFGRALRRAIESYPEDLSVAIVASGGLSHFVVDEELDGRVIEGLRTKDVETLTTIPRRFMRSGTSETLNWIAAGGALEHLGMELVDYVAAYRSPAGTGVGMAFAVWR
jgi:aromatic ring-opening dioxygenase LigB subunit